VAVTHLLVQQSWWLQLAHQVLGILCPVELMSLLLLQLAGSSSLLRCATWR
jgi:hypothetical protein